jgi:ubiquinone/menaquinone biosynthesis C-methylase UbiE
MNSIERFTDRVADYVRYRPHYPQAVFAELQSRLGLGPESIVADVGSGTGISTRPLLEMACAAFAVEPNAAMRRAAEQWLGGFPRFTSVAGTAEGTTLAERSVDAVVAAQAFHWFDAARARREFQRILKPSGRVILLWNERPQTGTPLLEAYEQLIQRFGSDYCQVKVNGRRATGRDQLCAFFGDGAFETMSFPNHQDFDFERLKGQLLSASYAPRAGQPNHDLMLAELLNIFGRYSTGGKVTLPYETNVYFGNLKSA